MVVGPSGAAGATALGGYHQETAAEVDHGALVQEGILGRQSELGALGAWLDAARNGSGRLILCAGAPGIGKTRLAQEVAGLALAGGTTVAWGRCVEAEGSPPFWPWRQVLRSLGLDPAPAMGSAVDPEDRFRVLDGLASTIREAAERTPVLVILDDVHWADEPSLLVLRHVALHLADGRLAVLATFRDMEPASRLPVVLPDLLRAPAVERVDLQGFGLAEVREQLERAGAGASGDTDAEVVLDVTAGNPLFVREVARTMADGTWRPDRPPRSVLDLVGDRLRRVSPSCRRLVQAAAVVGRDFGLGLVAASLGEPVETCLPLADEAVAHGLVDRVGSAADHRFVHALTREAVEASLTTADRVHLHRAVATAMQEGFAGEVSEHLGDIARHWSELAPYGEADRAREWALRAADDAVQRLAYAEGARLYRSALALAGTAAGDVERCRTWMALGRACYFAGDVQGCADAAVAAADAARAAGDPELAGEAALVLEVSADPGVNAVAEQLCGRALDGLGNAGHDALRARLLAQRSHLAYYDGDVPRTESLSAAALEVARESGDDRALAAAFHARKEACPGPGGRAERTSLADEMAALGIRGGNRRAVMWGALWRVEVLIECGDLAGASDALTRLEAAAERVGGPISAWHHDRVAACVAQAQGRYADAAALARRGLERMQPVEPGPARGTFFALHAAMAAHIGATEDSAPFVVQAFRPLPRFRGMAPLLRAHLLVCSGRPEDAAASYQLAGPIAGWAPNGFYMLVCFVAATVTAAAVGCHDDLAVLIDWLGPYRGEHASGDGVVYFGPVDLALGRAAAALGRMDDAVADLSAAAELADRAGAAGHAAEARFHLATALVARDGPGDRAAAFVAARHADRRAQVLGMAAYIDRTAALVASLGDAAPAALSRRETEVAQLVAEGLTNRQIADRLVISERTAQNHVQHILTKLGFSTRSQIAAWRASAGAAR